MLKQLETAISAFAHLALVSTFGLALTIGAAGISKATSGCMTCKPVFAALDGKRT